MKLSSDTRINAVMLYEIGKNEVLYSRDLNITLTEFLQQSIPHYLGNPTDVPNPSKLLDMDFMQESVCTNSYGHKFTILTFKNKNISCVINKLDLAGKVESPNFV